MKMTKRSKAVAGIDASKAKLDIAIIGETAFVVSNDEDGWVQAVEQLSRAGVELVGIEATGGYERGVTRYLQAAGFVVQVMQPLQVKAFAKLHLRRAKNDRIVRWSPKFGQLVKLGLPMEDEPDDGQTEAIFG